VRQVRLERLVKATLVATEQQTERHTLEVVAVVVQVEMAKTHHLAEVMVALVNLHQLLELVLFMLAVALVMAIPMGQVQMALEFGGLTLDAVVALLVLAVRVLLLSDTLTLSLTLQPLAVD
jgi:hypothetical protein